MNDTLDPMVVGKIQQLYGANEVARKLFDWVANLKNDAQETTIDRFMSRLGVARGVAVNLARDLEDAGCGRFVVGRKGSASRFEWGYSRVSLGQAAAGETDTLEPVSDDASEDSDEEATSKVRSPMTIPEVKASLALHLGIDPSQIEISIRG